MKKTFNFQQHIKDDFLNYFKTNIKEKNNLYYMLDRIHHPININESRKKQTTLNSFYKWYSTVVAIFLFPLLVAAYIWITSNNSKQLITENETTTMHGIIAI
jgi:hypothetical protein